VEGQNPAANFAQYDKTMCNAAMRAAVLGCTHVSVLQYPDAVGNGMVRTAHSTNVGALAQLLERIGPTKVSPFGKKMYEELEAAHDRKLAKKEALTQEGKVYGIDLGAWWERKSWELCVTLAETALLQGIVRAIFGVRRVRGPAGGGGAAAGGGVAGDGAAAAAGQKFLKGPLLDVWRKQWGIDCLCMLKLSVDEMLQVVTMVCLDYEEGRLRS
jgi:hypothetical protein